MLIDINKIIVTDRIRKDFGNIEELAEDIEANGLINPPTINKSYVLLAGERRLRACKMLGWPQIPVNMLDTKDEAHDLAVEMSENNMRRNFTGSELAEGIRRQMAIEQEKARGRQANSTGGANPQLLQTFAEAGKGTARDKAAEQFGISGEQARKTLFVDDHRDLLDPADFADWDEGRLSTNKAFQRIKAAQRQAERERDQALRELRQASATQSNLEAEAESLRRQLAERPEPEVVERTVEVEVESEASKRRIAELEHIKRVYSNDNQKLRKRNEEMHKELDRANGILGERSRTADASWDVIALTTATNQYLRLYGGKVWAFEQFDKVDEVTRREFVKAITSLAAFAQNLYQFVTDENKLGA